MLLRNSGLFMVIVSGLAAMVWASKSPSPTEVEEPELAAYMGDLQRYSHKLGLAIDAENQEAASFYLHELEEVAEEVIEEVEVYEEFPISDLSKALLMPQLERLEKEVAKSKNWKGVRENYSELIQQCNQCHIATKHAFIKITPGWTSHPFNQSF